MNRLLFIDAETGGLDIRMEFGCDTEELLFIIYEFTERQSIDSTMLSCFTEE